MAKVHVTCGDYKSVGIERIRVYRKVDGKWHETWRHPLYRRWRNILARAGWKTPSEMRQNRHEETYRNCTICDEWLNFVNFYRWAMANGYRKELTIDRIDNKKGYSPDNCRWATLVEQNRNRRMTEKWRAHMKLIASKGGLASAKKCRERALQRKAV